MYIYNDKVYKAREIYFVCAKIFTIKYRIKFIILEPWRWNMRRLWAFIVMLATVVLSLVFIGQPIMEKTSLSNEFAGGKELVYQLTKRDSSEGVSALEIDPEVIGANVNKRLDRAGIKNAHVEITGSGETANLRVSFVPKSASQLNEVKTQLKATGKLTICNNSDYCVTGNEFFDDTPVSLRYLGGNAYPGFNIRSKVIADSFYSQISDQENATVYIWQNYNPETDTYDKAFGENAREDVAEKVIASVVWSGNYIEEDLRLYLTADPNGQPFTLSSARSFVNAYTNSDYGCDVKFLYTTNIEAIYPANALTLTIAACLSIIGVIGICLCVFYKGAGFINLLTLLSVLGLQLLVGAYLGFEFAPASILAMVITVILCLYNLLNVNSRIKEELKKGRSITKAVAEGNRKSIMTLLDTCLITFVVSLFTFLIGNGMIKTFGGTLLFGSIFAFLAVLLINKWMTYFAAQSKLAKIGKKNLGLNISERSSVIIDKATATLTPKVCKKKRFVGLISGGVACCASIAILLGMGLTKGVFNISDEYVSSARIDIAIQSREEVYEDVETFKNHLITNYLNEEALGFEFSYIDYNFEREEKKASSGNDYAITYASFKIDSSLVNDVKLKEAVRNLDESLFVDVNSEFGDEFKDTKLIASASLSQSQVMNVHHDTMNMLLILGLSLLFSSIYIFIRFGISWFISYLGISVLTNALMFALFSIMMLPYNSVVAFGMIAVDVLLSFILVPLFSKNRELLKDQRIVKTATIEERITLMDQAIKSIFGPYATIGLTILLTSVILIAVTAGNLMLSAIMIFALTSCLGMFFLLYFAPSFYLYLRSHIKFKEINFKKFKRKRKPVKVNTNEPHETIIPGLNEFR